MDRFHERFPGKRKWPWMEEEEEEEIPCPTPVRSIPPPELWEENNQQRQKFQNQPPAAGDPRADLDLNQPSGSPEKRLRGLFPMKDGDGQYHPGTSESGAKGVPEDTQQSYGPNFGPTSANPKQSFQGEPPAVRAPSAGCRISGFHTYMGQHQPAMAAANGGDGMGGGLQLFREDPYWQATSAATIGGQVGDFPMYPEKNKPIMDASDGLFQTYPNQNRPAVTNSGDVGGFPVYPEQHRQETVATNVGAGVPMYSEQYGFQLFREHKQPVTGTSNEGIGGLPWFPEQIHPAMDAANANNESSRSFKAGAGEEYASWPFHLEVDPSHVNSPKKPYWDLNY